MSLSFSLFKSPLPPLPSSTPISHVFSPFLIKPTATRPPTTTPIIKAMKSVQGKVVCATNDKTVAVEVTRLAPHPKYKRRIRIKKKYQAHDPDNQFKVGDLVQLEKCRPISMTKTFLAVPVVDLRSARKTVEAVSGELDLPLESQLSPGA